MKSPKNHSFLLAIALAVTLLIIGTYAYMYHAIDQSADRIVGARDKVRLADAKKNRDQNFLKSYQSAADDWGRLPLFFIPSDHAVTFIESLETLGVESGGNATISAIDQDNFDNAPSGTVKSIRAHVEIVGTWESVMRSLSLAEIMPYMVTLNNVRLGTDGASDAKNRKPNWRLSFDVSALVMVPVGSTGIIDSKPSVTVRVSPTPTVPNSAVKLK